MQASQKGLDFFKECFLQYWNNRMFLPIVCCVCLIFIILKKSKVWNDGIIFPLLLLGVTIYNPFLMEKILEKVNFSSRYYRFYWIMPIAVIVAAAVMICVERIKSFFIKGIIIVVFYGAVVYCGSGVIVNTDDWNLYKIDSNVFEISHIIHEDTDEETPVVFVDTSLHHSIRQYDPSLITVLNSSPTEYYSLTCEMEQVYDACIRMEKYLVIIGNYNHELDAKLVNQGFINEKVDYFVRNKEWFSEEYISSLNVFKVGESERYEVYRVLQQK